VGVLSEVLVIWVQAKVLQDADTVVAYGQLQSR